VVVKPLCKKEDKTRMMNSWPIMLLTVFAKVFKEAVRSRLSHYLHTSNILVTEQPGFRKGMSTENAAFRLTDSKYVNQKMCVGGTFCDLAKSFDCVNHEILLVKLHFCGIGGGSADWLRIMVGALPRT
jgi:hypothetical protein